MALGTPWLGGRGYIGMGEESTPGTPVTATVWPPVTSFNAKMKQTQTPVPSLRTLSGGPSKPMVILKQWGEISVTGQFTYDNWGMFLSAAFGSASSGGGGGPTYTNTYTTGTTAITLDHHTIDAFVSGDVSERIQIGGAVCNSLTITAPKHDFATIEVDFIAIEYLDFDSGTARTAPTNLAPCHGSEVSVSIGGTAHTDAVESVTIRINNNVEPLDTVGSLNPRLIRHVNGRTVEIEATLYADSTYTRALIDDRLAGTAQAVVVTFSDGTHSHTFTAPSAYIAEDIEVPTNDVGQIMVKVKFACHEVDTGSPTAMLTLSTVSRASTATGNG